MCVCLCVCMLARARACVHAYMSAYVCVSMMVIEFSTEKRSFGKEDKELTSYLP